MPGGSSGDWLGMYRRAVRYGYSNTRVKAMESKLMDSATMRSVAEAKDVGSVLAILFQTDYGQALTKFGGMELSPAMLDFALSENLAERVNALARITPKRDRRIIREMISQWDLNNVKRVLEAVDRHQPYDAVSRYLIGAGEFPLVALQQAMAEGSVEGALGRLMRSSHYRRLLGEALSAYRKGGSLLDALAAMDAWSYSERSGIARELDARHDRSAALVRMDIDMRNVITLLRAKRRGARFHEVSGQLVDGGRTSAAALGKAYGAAGDIPEFAVGIRAFDLSGATEAYRGDGNLIAFEISMRNQIFRTSRRLLRQSLLSVGALVDYVYLKEIEMFTLRTLVKSKEYGLTKDEVSRLVVWSL